MSYANIDTYLPFRCTKVTKRRVYHTMRDNTVSRHLCQLMVQLTNQQTDSQQHMAILCNELVVVKMRHVIEVLKPYSFGQARGFVYF